MEIEVPSPPPEFNFDSTNTTPYLSAASSPQRFGSSSFFYSAPASPTRAFYSSIGSTSFSTIPFHWEEKPGTPKAARNGKNSTDIDTDTDEDFAFDFSGQFDTSSLHADELFDGGKIKPLKPPPRMQYQQDYKPTDSPKSPHSPRSPKNFIREAFSPRRKKDFDPFAAAMEQAQREGDESQEQSSRGRQKTIDRVPSTSQHKKTRSLSPFRVSDMLFDRDEEHGQAGEKNSSFFSSFWTKNWKIKDLLLFRSASESRVSDKKAEAKKFGILRKNHQYVAKNQSFRSTEKNSSFRSMASYEHRVHDKSDEFKKHAIVKKSDDVRNSSFRSTDSVGSVSNRRRAGPTISAHELHYTLNRAVSEEMKRRTSLPYKQGLWGCLGFNPTVNELGKGISPSGSLSRR